MKQYLLVSLDCLLDTRLGVLTDEDPSIPARILETPESANKYRNRLRDDFEDYGVGFDKFQELWRNRNAGHLPKSMMTPFVFELADITSQVVKQHIEATHTLQEFEVHLNFYPYKDLDDGTRQQIIEAIVARLHYPVMVRDVYLSLKTLTPQYIKNNDYSTLIMYDFREWLETQYHAGIPEEMLEVMKIPQHVFYAPSLFADVDKLKELIEFRSPNDETMDPLDGMQFMFKPFFHLEFLGPEHFSIIDPKLYLALEEENNRILKQVG